MRRTPEEMAQAALETAERKLQRAADRVVRARHELQEADIARTRARMAVECAVRKVRLVEPEWRDA